MWRRLPLLGLACLLAIPLVRFAILEANEHEVDRTTATWKAREALIARAQVLSPPRRLPAPADLAYVAAGAHLHVRPEARQGDDAKVRLPAADGRSSR